MSNPTYAFIACADVARRLDYARHSAGIVVLKTARNLTIAATDGYNALRFDFEPDDPSVVPLASLPLGQYRSAAPAPRIQSGTHYRSSLDGQRVTLAAYTGRGAPKESRNVSIDLERAESHPLLEYWRTAATHVSCCTEIDAAQTEAILAVLDGDESVTIQRALGDSPGHARVLCGPVHGAVNCDPFAFEPARVGVYQLAEALAAVDPRETEPRRLYVPWVDSRPLLVTAGAGSAIVGQTIERP